MSANHIPYLENESRKGETKAKAIFGDKHADLLQDIAPEGQELFEKYASRDDLNEEASRAAALMALHQAAAQHDWSTERIEAVTKQIDAHHPASQK